MSRRVIVVSDLHIAPPGRLNSFHAHAALAGLLRESARVPETTLVLNGDVLDLLQIEGRSPGLGLALAAAFVDETLDQLAHDPGGRDVLVALGEVARGGTTCIVIPGNHDPELLHPD